jgi:competence transcription factor ComK
MKMPNHLNTMEVVFSRLYVIILAIHLEKYTVRYEEVVFVIHVFKKKSKKKSETPKQDKELIEKRLQWARQIYEEQYGKKKKKG